jgi:hypothetical protein
MKKTAKASKGNEKRQTKQNGKEEPRKSSKSQPPLKQLPLTLLMQALPLR